APGVVGRVLSLVFVVVLRINRGMFVLVVVVSSVVQEVFERVRAHDIALSATNLGILEIEMQLRGCELVIGWGLAYVNAGVPRRKRRPQLVGVESNISEAAGQTPTKTEMDCNHAIRLDRHDPERRRNG